MYAIFEKETQKQVCAQPPFRTAKMAWDYFQEHQWKSLQTLPDGAVLDWNAGDHRKYFVCRLVGARVPVLRVPGHTLWIETIIGGGRPATFTGNCTCGWNQNWSSREEVTQMHRRHLEALPTVDLAPRLAENLSASKVR
jgi:hypothetical protein